MKLVILWLVLFTLAISAPLGLAQPDPSIFDKRRYVPQPTATPEAARPVEPSEPIPVGWSIAGLAVVAVVSSILLIKSLRAWRSSNIFDRQYRFPDPGPAALRFGANRCGGHMATIDFGYRVRAIRTSVREDT